MAVSVQNKASDRLTLNMNLNGFRPSAYTLAGWHLRQPVLSSYFRTADPGLYKTDGTYNILTSDFPRVTFYNTVAVTNMDKRYLKGTEFAGEACGQNIRLSKIWN